MLGEMSPRRLRRKVAGLTLVEAVVTMGIIAVLAAVALPSMRNFMLQQRVKSFTRELLADVQLARSTAMQQTGTGVGTFLVAFSFSTETKGICYAIVPAQDAAVDCDCSRSGAICGMASATSLARTPVKIVNIDTSRGLSVTRPAGRQLFYLTGTGMVDDKLEKAMSVSGGSTSLSLNIVVSGTGIPRICTPSGSTIAGYPAC